MTPELESALVSGLVGGVLGALAAYVFDLRKEQRAREEGERLSRIERAELRASVASAILQDLRECELLFRQLYESEAPTSAIVSRPHFYFDELKGETRWFDAKSICPIAEFFRLVGVYFEAGRLLRETGGGRISSTPTREHEMRAQAGFILQALPEAMVALVAEGAAIDDPTPKWDAVQFPSLPKVPPPAFAKTRRWLEERGRLPKLPDA